MTIKTDPADPADPVNPAGADIATAGQAASGQAASGQAATGQANPPDAPEQAAPREVVSFRVQEMDFCVGITSVREIRGWTPATVLPQAQGFVTGVINLRGTVVAVIDLARRLGLGTTSPGPRHVILIVALNGRLTGLLADTVSDIMTLDAETIRPLPAQLADRARDFMSGIATLPDGRMLRMLDLAHVLPANIGAIA